MNDTCQICGHVRSKHCKGGVSHITYKDEARMNKAAVAADCVTAHCLQPLCSCTNFSEAA